MKRPSYYVHYVRDSSPQFKKFKSLKAARAFAADFVKKSPGQDSGYWVDFILKGEVLDADDYYQESL